VRHHAGRALRDPARGRVRPPRHAHLVPGSYLTGSILTETIFGWPGLGRYVLTAIEKRDLPAIQGSILFMSLIFVLVNLVTDLVYAKADPRIAYD
jgi:ABC-type dipeptide/oligopeptide/nickel transport system permease component